MSQDKQFAITADRGKDEVLVEATPAPPSLADRASGGSAASGRRRALGLFACVAALAAVCAGLTSAASAGGGATKPTLTVAASCDQTPLGLGTGILGFDFVYESLIHQKADATFGPALATSWTVRPGNKVMTLTLRRGVRFSDGTPMDAAAVKTWLDYKSSKGDTLQTMGPVRSVDVLGKYVVRITLKSPNPDFRLAVSSTWRTDWGHVTSPRAIERVKADPKSTLLSSQTFGAGPYVLLPSQTVAGDHCTYVPNKFYYNKAKIKWGKIIFKQIADPNTVLSALKTKQIDVALFAAGTTATAADAAGFKVVVNRNGSLAVRWLDRGGKLYPALAELRVRQALNYAIDRRTLVRAGLCPYGATPTSLTFAGNVEPDDPKYVNYYTYDPAKAKALLTAAGYPNGFSLKINALGPWAGGHYTVPLAEAIAKYFAAVGVRMDVAGNTLDEWVDGMSSRKSAGFLVPYGRVSTWLIYQLDLRKDTNTEGDQHGWHDPVLDRLWLKGQRASPKAAAAIWRQLNARLVLQAHSVPICRSSQLAFVSKSVGGIRDHTGSVHVNSLTEWYPADK